MTFIKGIASIGAAILIGLSASSAQAGYVVDLTQTGGNVVATGSGAIDLTGLSLDHIATSGCSANGGINPPLASISIGPVISAPTQVYVGFTGPKSFGIGGFTLPSSGSGDIVAIDGFFEELSVPLGYISDSPLSDTATYDSQTFSSLGATPGTYKWTWGSGANQNFTLVIGTVVPEPSTWAMMLLGFAGLAFMGYQSAARRRLAASHASPAIGRSVAR
jgi:hypothetical protein